MSDSRSELVATVRAFVENAGSDYDHLAPGQKSRLETLDALGSLEEQLQTAQAEVERLQQLDRDHSKRHANTAERALRAEEQVQTLERDIATLREAHENLSPVERQRADLRIECDTWKQTAQFHAAKAKGLQEQLETVTAERDALIHAIEHGPPASSPASQPESSERAVVESAGAGQRAEASGLHASDSAAVRSEDSDPASRSLDA